MKKSIQINYTTRQEKIEGLFATVYEWLTKDKGFDKSVALDILADYTRKLKSEEVESPDVLERYVSIIELAVNDLECDTDYVAEGFESILFNGTYGGLI